VGRRRSASLSRLKSSKGGPYYLSEGVQKAEESCRGGVTASVSLINWSRLILREQGASLSLRVGKRGKTKKEQ